MSALATFVGIHGPGSSISRMATTGPAGYGSSQMTVYEGAVRIVGKDGRELMPWRVAVYEMGRVIRYTTVPAPTGAEAARRAQALYPKGTAIAF